MRKDTFLPKPQRRSSSTDTSGNNAPALPENILLVLADGLGRALPSISWYPSDGPEGGFSSKYVRYSRSYLDCGGRSCI
jgi:hypothetical protein